MRNGTTPTSLAQRHIPQIMRTRTCARVSPRFFFAHCDRITRLLPSYFTGSSPLLLVFPSSQMPHHCPARQTPLAAAASRGRRFFGTAWPAHVRSPHHGLLWSIGVLFLLHFAPNSTEKEVENECAEDRRRCRRGDAEQQYDQPHVSIGKRGEKELPK